MASPAERFLKVHRSEIVGRVKSVNGLADCLLEKEVISKEALNEISSQKPEEEQMRTVYKHLNSSKAYELTLEWLKRHESHVMEDLAEKTETPEPSHSREKRQRIQNHEAMDETDCDLQTSPDLKTLSTMAKLDDWVSDPKISEKLVNDLKEKLAQGEMEGLEDYLKDIKLKKSLCLTAKEINEIRQRKDLRSFLTDVKGAKFPKNTLDHFFEKVRSKASTAKKKPEQYSNYDDSINHNADDLNSSGYGSSCSSSFNSRVFPHTVFPNEDVFICEGVTDVSHTHNMEVTDYESKSADLDFKADVPHPTENADQIQQAVRSSGGTRELKEKQEMDDTDCPPQTSSQNLFNVPLFAKKSKLSSYSPSYRTKSIPHLKKERWSGCGRFGARR
ncbi:uncharacterized protein LOC134320271 isoform X1 [Trichomycterus rosablanca]|uniref:uncharacterized protein LOC134320271 isoform X1 n=1 Tax=Trichomycterus rosablanca TaxID=2290929 RepID=UPI002F358939